MSKKSILRSTCNKAILRESTQTCLPTKARTLKHSLYRMPQFQETKFLYNLCLGTASRFLGPVVLVTTGVDVAWMKGIFLYFSLSDSTIIGFGSIEVYLPMQKETYS